MPSSFLLRLGLDNFFAWADLKLILLISVSQVARCDPPIPGSEKHISTCFRNEQKEQVENNLRTKSDKENGMYF
jgi:hypothetical protein